eukprot:11175236-Lingulodinium_polyedra.AAC.2
MATRTHTNERTVGIYADACSHTHTQADACSRTQLELSLPCPTCSVQYTRRHTSSEASPQSRMMRRRRASRWGAARQLGCAARQLGSP